MLLIQLISKYHPKVPDTRLGFFSNDPNEGLMYQGTEGWHVDGNTVDLPHTFTIIHCISANKNGPTLLVPLREIVESLTPEERSTIIFMEVPLFTMALFLFLKFSLEQVSTWVFPYL